MDPRSSAGPVSNSGLPWVVVWRPRELRRFWRVLHASFCGGGGIPSPSHKEWAQRPFSHCRLKTPRRKTARGPRPLLQSRQVRAALGHPSGQAGLLWPRECVPRGLRPHVGAHEPSPRAGPRKQRAKGTSRPGQHEFTREVRGLGEKAGPPNPRLDGRS